MVGAFTMECCFVVKDITMGHAAPKPSFTAEDYLAWENTQLDRHVTVAGNVYMALRQHLSGSPCRTFMSDMRLQVASTNSYFYPDVLVTCSGLDAASALAKTEPKLIVEVLSPSTAAFDRGQKFSHYRSIASLEEYALIDLDTRCTDCYRLGADGLWVLHPFAEGQAVQLASVALKISTEQLFAEVPEA